MVNDISLYKSKEDTDAFVEERFRRLMDLVRDNVSYEVKNEIIELWTEMRLQVNLTGWKEGYDKGIDSCRPF